MCHPVKRIRMMARTIMFNSVYTAAAPLEQYDCRDVGAIGEVIENSIDDIEYLVCLAEDDAIKLFHENKRLQAEIYELKHNIETEVKRQIKALS